MLSPWLVACRGKLLGLMRRSTSHRSGFQALVDAAPEAENYCTDGFWGYVDVVYLGKHVRNIHNKNDTFTVEGINADLRHYIPVLCSSCRCFCRRLETLIAVVSVFVDAYNKFGDYKAKHRIPVMHKLPVPNKRLHKFRDLSPWTG
jgi:IS1 family transposase